MSKEVKITSNYKGTALPAVYATDQLKIGETGAIVIYRQETKVVNEDQSEDITSEVKAIAFRFGDALSVFEESNTDKLTSQLSDILQSYAGDATVFPMITFSGVVSYDPFYNEEMKHYSLKVKLGYAVVAQVWYLGSIPTATSEPTQVEYSFSNGEVPKVLTNLINNVAASAIKKDLYGG